MLSFLGAGGLSSSSHTLHPVGRRLICSMICFLIHHWKFLSLQFFKITPACATRNSGDLLSRSEAVILEGVAVVLVHGVNAHGMAESRRWNERGVDLNRNYGHMWGLDNQGSSGSPTSQTYRGTAPFSEPETAAMRSFAESRDLAVAFSMHSYSNYFFIPPGYATGAFAPPPLDAQYDLLAQGTSTLGPGWTTGTPWQILYPANGTTQDWWYGDQYSISACRNSLLLI